MIRRVRIPGMRDFDFHPGESTVRTFGVPDIGVLVNDDTTCVMQTRQPNEFDADGDELVLRRPRSTDGVDRGWSADVPTRRDTHNARGRCTDAASVRTHTD